MVTNAYELSRLDRLSSLNIIEQQLKGFGKNPDKLFNCLHYLKDIKRHCPHSCVYFAVIHPRLFAKAHKALNQKWVSAEEFSTIIRTLFCGDHMDTRKFSNYKDHFEELWEKATEIRRKSILEAFRNYQRDSIKKILADGSATPEEKNQLRESLKSLVSLREDANNAAKQSPTSRRSSLDPRTISRQHRKIDEVDIKRGKEEGSLLSADPPTVLQTTQHGMEQGSFQLNHLDGSQENSHNPDAPKANGLSPEPKFTPWPGASIFDVLRDRLNLSPPHLEESTPPPTRQKKEMLFGGDGPNSPQGRSHDFASYAASPSDFELLTPPKLDRAISTARKSPRTDWDSKLFSPAPSSLTPRSPAPSSPIPSFSTSPSLVLSFSTPSSPAPRPILPLRPFTSRTKLLSGPKNTWNPLDSAIPKQPLPEPTPGFLGGIEHSEITNSLPAQGKGDHRFKSRVSSVLPTTPVSAQNTTLSAGELRVETPRQLLQDLKLLLGKPLEPTLARVYVLKAPNYFKEHLQAECVKIGMTCVKGKDGANHNCRHKEWFAVPEEVALQTVKRWLRFIESMPYFGQKRYSETSGIKDHWQTAIEKLQVESMSNQGIQYGELSTIYEKWMDNAIGNGLSKRLP